jgi:hypothetical protein
MDDEMRPFHRALSAAEIIFRNMSRKMVGNAHNSQADNDSHPPDHLSENLNLATAALAELRGKGLRAARERNIPELDSVISALRESADFLQNPNKRGRNPDQRILDMQLLQRVLPLVSEALTYFEQVKSGLGLQHE